VEEEIFRMQSRNGIEKKRRRKFELFLPLIITGNVRWKDKDKV